MIIIILPVSAPLCNIPYCKSYYNTIANKPLVPLTKYLCYKQHTNATNKILMPVRSFSLVPQSSSSLWLSEATDCLLYLSSGLSCRTCSGICRTVSHEQFSASSSTCVHTVGRQKMMVRWWHFRPSIWSSDGGLYSLGHQPSFQVISW